MKSGYMVVDHTADKAIAAWAPDYGELLRQCACGLISLIGDTAELHPTELRVVEAESPDQITMLHDILTELLYLVEDEGQIPVCIGNVWLSGERVRLEVGIVPLDCAIGQISGDVKAVTYHELEIVSDAGMLRITVIFDT